MKTSQILTACALFASHAWGKKSGPSCTKPEITSDGPSMANLKTGLALLAIATSTSAQYYGGYTGGSNNPYSSSNGATNGDGSSSFGGQSSGSFGGFGLDFSQYKKTVMAHALLAALAFGEESPIGNGTCMELMSRRLLLSRGRYHDPSGFVQRLVACSWAVSDVCISALYRRGGYRALGRHASTNSAVGSH